MRTSALSKLNRLLQLAHLVNENSRILEEEHFQKKLLSRREILKLSAGIGGLTAALPLSSSFAKSVKSGNLPNLMEDQSNPIIILGGGVAGLVAAYQLQKKGIACSIFEASQRLGGRMFTVPNFNSDKMFCELGGELVDTNHRALLSLCAELGIGIQDLTQEDQGLEKDLYSADGKIISPREMVVAFQPLAAQIAKDLREIWGDLPSRMATYKDKNNPIIIKYDGMSLSSYLYGKKNVDKWVLDLITTLYTCEFGLEAEEQSALNFLSMVTIGVTIGATHGANGGADDKSLNMKVLGVSDEKFRIEGGSSALCNALVKALRGKVPFHLGHELIRVQDKSGRLSFTFKSGSTLVVRAQRAICTIPFSTLRLVEGINALDLNPDLKKGISELGYGSTSKWVMSFKSRFWRTDKKYPSNGAILSVERQQFWDSSRMQKGSSGILSRFLAGRKSNQISYDNLEKDLQFLDQIYPGAKNEFDNKYLLMPWGEFQWSKGCYSCFRPGQFTAINGLAEESQLGGRFLFAGEHTSVDYGGFMNGAIESGMASANKIILSIGIAAHS